MLPPVPRWTRRMRVRDCPFQSPGTMAVHPTATAFPVFQPGRRPRLPFSRLARRSLALRPACSRSRLKRPFPSRATAIRCLLIPPRLLPAEANHCRRGLPPPEEPRLTWRDRTTGNSSRRRVPDVQVQTAHRTRVHPNGACLPPSVFHALSYPCQAFRALAPETVVRRLWRGAYGAEKTL